MSEKMAGIFALNVINEKDYMEINGVKILKKEFNGEKVLTAWDIAKIHRRETREINQNLKNLQGKMVEGEDYFFCKKNELHERYLEGIFIPNNVKRIALFKANGYAKLIKTFIFENNYKIIEETYKFLDGKNNINLYLPKENSEILFKEMLEETLNELKIGVEHQYPAGKYRIDFFIPEYNLAVEYDESYHELKVKEDSEREEKINKILGCDFIRCSYKDSNIKNIIKILKKIGVIIG